MAFRRRAPMAGLSWLTGPIFDEELRVSSRRRRNYVLRFTYVTLFLVVISLLWIEEMPRGSVSVFQISRMAQVAQHIILFVVCFPDGRHRYVEHRDQ